MANMFGRKHDINIAIGQGRRKLYEGPVFTVSKLHALWTTNGLKLTVILTRLP